MAKELDAYVNEALELQNNGYLEEAASLFLEGFSLYPDWRLPNEAGCCYQQLGMYPKAVEAFKAALDQTPDRNFILFNIGQTYSMMGSFSEARQVLSELWTESLDPKTAFELGLISMKEQKWDEALEIFDKALFYDITLNGYTMSGSQGLNPELAVRILLNKARIFGFELNRRAEAEKMLQALFKEFHDAGRIFTYAREAINRDRKDLAVYAAGFLLPDYHKYAEVQELCDSLGLSPE